MSRTDLEQLVDRGLKALPAPRAPRTLLPTVMSAVRAAAARPWYTRPWFTWPSGWQVASAVAMLLVLAGGALVVPVMQPYVGPVIAVGEAALSPAAQVVSAMETLASAVEIVSRVIGQSVVGIVFTLFAVMLTTSIIVAAAIGRVALGGAYQS